MTFIVECTAPNGKDREKEVTSRSAAEDKKAELKDLGFTNIEIKPANGNGAASEAKKKMESMADEPNVEVVNHQEDHDLPDSANLESDPVDWLPGHFIDEIQGVPTLNRKGYAVMCERFGVSVKSTAVTLASETSFEYAEFEAVATTEDGTEYSGFGSAHIERMDGDDQYLLNELAETRAMKRAAAWATGIGMTAASEMKGEL